MNQPFKTYYSSTSSGASPFLSACGAKSNMQAPENTQNYNRFAYCLNNSMKYTDPIGFTSYYVNGVQVSFQDYRMMGDVKLGAHDNLKKTYRYTDYNTLCESTMKYSITGLANNDPFENKWNYIIDPATSNLSTRTNTLTVNGTVQRNLTENFEYDNLDRLLNVYKGVAIPANLTQALSYMPNGNIETKTEAGTVQNFQDYTTKPHAPSTIDPMASPLTVQAITYTPFNKINSVEVVAGLSSSKYRQTLTYGTDLERRKTIDQFTADNGTTYTDVRTKYYAQNYELITQGTTTKELHYISAPDGLAAIYELKNGVGTMYYAQTDYQGSVMMLVKADGNRKNDLSFDAWGNRRDPNTWTLKTATDFVAELNTPTLITDRGYTMHEHLDVYGLINMNGRAYDQRLGQFLSPDPFVQAPQNPQNYNRYAYCLNNPMKYTDPSGYNYSFTIDGETYWGMDANWFMRHNMDNLNSIGWNGHTIWDADKNERIYYNSRKGEMGAYVEGIQQSAKDYHTYLSSSLYGSDYGKDGIENHLSYSTPFNVELNWMGFSSFDLIRFGKFNYTNQIEIELNNTKYPGVKIYYDLNRRTGYYSPFSGIHVGEKDYMVNNQDWLQHEYGHYLQYKKNGFAYWALMAQASIQTAVWGQISGNWKYHDYNVVEMEANSLSIGFFGLNSKINKYPNIYPHFGIVGPSKYIYVFPFLP